ncbi:MAG: mediator of RNA polymerase II transcription subunit 11 [Janthinobacterium lividum]
MLSSAGNALAALTNKPLNPDHNAAPSDDLQMDDGSGNTDADPAAHKEGFTKHATAYFTHLQAIMARLRRQAYALEEAGIIATEAPTLSTTGASEPAQRQATGPGSFVRRGGSMAMGTAPMQQRPAPTDDSERITNGGLGSLDVGLLNSRGNSVGIEKEAELIAEAKAMLQEMVAERDAKAMSDP